MSKVLLNITAILEAIDKIELYSQDARTKKRAGEAGLKP